MTTRYRNFRLVIGSVTLNSNVRAGQSFYQILNVPEILTSLSVRNQDVPKQGGHGAVSGLSFYGPRTVPVMGEICATTSALRYSMEQDLKQELALPMAQSFDNEDGYILILVTDQDGTEKQLYAKILEPPTFQLLPGVAERRSSFRFILYAEDPLIYGQDLNEESGTETIAGTNLMVVEGASPTVPLTLYEDTAPSLTCDNSGPLDAPPVIIVYGPTTNPKILNQTTDVYMHLNANGGLTLEEGERVEIDFNAQSITKFDSDDVETNVSGTLSATSDWLLLAPGENDIALLDGSSSEIEATITVQWRDTYL